MDEVTGLFRVLGDATRLRTLHLLRGGELCVGDLVTLLGVPQPTASRHLAALRAAGLVAARRDGPWSFYALAPARGELHERLLACVAAAGAEDAALRRDTRRAERLRARGGCCPERAREAGAPAAAEESRG